MRCKNTTKSGLDKIMASCYNQQTRSATLCVGRALIVAHAAGSVRGQFPVSIPSGVCVKGKGQNGKIQSDRHIH